ncbi:penicillin-binding protein, partial [Yersinia pestis]|nr:penicillin-binding protein [Yersinia pestis]MRP95963.1 penicillin-binding protein [Yersinia pestis]
ALLNPQPSWGFSGHKKIAVTGKHQNRNFFSTIH